MRNHRGAYEQEYSSLGTRLTARDAMPLRRIELAEKRLGVVAPQVLRAYYQIAGRETRLNGAFNRLLPPEEWIVDQKHLIFMEENQAVVLWGVAATGKDVVDPAVYVGVNGDEIEWHREHRQCSTFLSVMLHWQGAFGGGLPFTSTAVASVALRRILRRNWRFVGEVNRMQAFAKRGKTVCHLSWDDGWRVFAGAVEQRKIDEISNELSLTWRSGL
jgi:hypothetical protein